MEEPDQKSPISTFAVLVLAFVLWITVVVIVLPRLLGRVLAFVCNRRADFHITIPAMYIYPLAGRVVAHSVQYTIPDASISVEELVLQIRWWRKVHEQPFGQLLTVDDPHTLHPVAVEQQQMEREDSAFWAKRVFYRIRRWWRRTAMLSDSHSTEPRPLISLICVGLRARMVNTQRNHLQLKMVLDAARAAKSDRDDDNANTAFQLPLTTRRDSHSLSSSSKDGLPPSSTNSASSSVASVDEKPFAQRMLELASLRITDGAIYFCDMGESPLLRVTVNSAKLRYRYGAPPCPVDLCRKRVRIRVSGLAISVASHDAVQTIVAASQLTPPEKVELCPTDLQSQTEHSPTNRMLSRLVSMGSTAIPTSFSMNDGISQTKFPRRRKRSSKRPRSTIPKLSDLQYKDRREAKVARKPQTLPCVDVIKSSTTIINYVFDEPGVAVGEARPVQSSSNIDPKIRSTSYPSDDQNSLPPPVCRVSILLRGALCSLDTQAIADIERIVERIQPPFFDLVQFAQRLQSQDGRRSASGIEIEVDATPEVLEASKELPTASPIPILKIPFVPREKTWKALTALGVRDWSAQAPNTASAEHDDDALPPSCLALYASDVSFRTAIPLELGMAQTLNISANNVAVNAEGVADLPMGRAKTLSVSRIVQLPVIWNEEHLVTSNITLKESEVVFLPDFMRIIEDAMATIQRLSKQPAGVRYFIPYKEISTIRAEEGYTIICSCSHANAWHNIHHGVADSYGRVRITGEKGELVLSPNVPTEYYPDATVLSWSLSLPDAVGSFEFIVPGKVVNREANESALQNENTPGSRTSSVRSRPPSLAKRVRSQLELFMIQSQENSTQEFEGYDRRITIDILHVGSTFKLSGKVTGNEARNFLGTPANAFLDAVNRSDLAMKASSVTLDLNPHHVTAILNLIRNYAGPGLCTLKESERAELGVLQENALKCILAEARYPSAAEALQLGLGAGFSLSSYQHLVAMDDIVCMTFQIDYLLVRAHDLPHAYVPFDRSSESIFSLDCERFSGGVEANRLGLSVSVGPDTRNNVVALHAGYVDVPNDEEGYNLRSLRSLVSPRISLEQVSIQKVSYSSEEWGAYYSELRINVASLKGCLLDSMAPCISRILVSAFPHQLHENSSVGTALLTVDNIDVNLGLADVLVLSPSSIASASRSGQMNSLTHDRMFNADEGKSGLYIPKFLSGVTHVQVPSGFRFHMTNSATESMAARGRLLLPNVALDLLMPSDGKLIPWMDEVTLLAQVAHSTTMRNDPVRGMFHDTGLVRRAAELRSLSLDILIESRPRHWATHVFRLQRSHIRKQGFAVRNSDLVWCSDHIIPRIERKSSRLSRFHEESWWLFHSHSKRASILTSYVTKNLGSSHRMDFVSVRMISNTAILISPECVEVVNDIVVRQKEYLQKRMGSSKRPHAKTADDDERSRLDIGEIIDLWRLYESSKCPKWASLQSVVPSSSLRAFETKDIRIILTTPAITMDLVDRNTVISRPSILDEVIFSVPHGVHFLQVCKTVSLQEEHQQRNSGSFGRCHMKMLHLSLPSFKMYSNEREIAKAAGIVVVFRSKYTRQERPALPRDERHTLVVRLASLSIGNRESSLKSFACLGRIGSIFLLLSRAVSMELTAYKQLKTERRERQSDALFSLDVSELNSIDAKSVRRVLVDMSQAAFDPRDVFLKAAGRPELLSSQRMEHESRQRSSQDSIINSIDVFLKNLSVRIMNEELFYSDSFQCKGGSSIGVTSIQSSLGGYVLNASFGKLLMSIRDDIAADTLQMVSEVASFVRRAAFSVPMISYGGPADGPKKLSKSEALLLSHNSEDFREGVGGVHPGSFRGHSSIATRLHAGTTRLSRPNRRRPHKAKFPVSKSLRDLPKNNITSRTLTSESSRSEDQPRILSRGIQSSGLFSTRRREYSREPVPQVSSPSRSTSRQAVRGPSSKSHAGDGLDRSTRPIVSDSGSANVVEDDYTLVAVRTAGEHGPPRKRSKSMVRVSPVIPPAFFDSPSQQSSEDRERSERMPSRVIFPRSSSSSRVERATNYSRGNDYHVVSSDAPTAVHGDEEESNLQVSNRTRDRSRRFPQVTIFVSCKEISGRYYRSIGFERKRNRAVSQPDINIVVAEPRLTFMSAPSKGSSSIVVTASGARLQSANNPRCVLTGSIGKIGLTVSLAENYVVSTLPKLIASAQVSHFKTVLHATDLQSVLGFREEFKNDVLAIISASLKTNYSISEMARATRLSATRSTYPGRNVYSTLAFDLRCDNSVFKLEGFHPKDSDMELSYLLDGLFFSLVASEDDKAALTLGLRLYGHGLSVSAPSWESSETLKFPSLDARGVQWGEATGLPTILKVTAEPLINSTSIHGLKHVLFTVSGLLAFQNVTGGDSNDMEKLKIEPTAIDTKSLPVNQDSQSNAKTNQGGGSPFTRSYAAWERTKGVRMDISIRPMSFSLSSGQVVAVFDVEAITGIFEWNKLVVSGVQMHSAVSVPRISLSLIRMSTADFVYADIRPNEHRTSLSIALEKTRLDLLKTQEDLTHTFIFRLDVFKVSGHARPWKLLLDAASWADEQEFVAELQSINYNATTSNRSRQTKPPSGTNQSPVEHRVILVGANLRRFLLAVPLLSSEDVSSSRLAVRAAELHLMVRKRFDNISTPIKNVMEMKMHFIGVLWEQSPLLSSHHARISFSVCSPTTESTSLFGPTSVILVPGTWRICPRKDVVMAILDAKNRKDNKKASEKTKELLANLPDYASRHGSSIAGDSFSIATERQGRVLFEAISVKALKTSGFIEGLDEGNVSRRNLSAPTLREADSTVPKPLEASKLGVPSFGISFVREIDSNFDLVDIDFSGGEGEFPRGCLGKISNLLIELLGAVASDQEQSGKKERTPAQLQPSRDIARDVSVLIRFGKSSYRGQEDLNLPVESKFAFFAMKSSSILISVRTAPVFGNERNHSTVITGISPRLSLDITPIVEGASEQSLRLKDARILHGTSPSYAPHTLLHINRVVGQTEAKTLLLTESRLRGHSSSKSVTSDSGTYRMPSAAVTGPDRKLLLMFGKPRSRGKARVGTGQSSQRESKPELAIRLQLKLPSKKDAYGDQVDLFVEQVMVGVNCVRSSPSQSAFHLNVHCMSNDVVLKAKWDILECKLKLREDLLCYDQASRLPSRGGSRVLVHIINRLHFGCMQFAKNTVKLDIDALATVFTAPSYEVVIESTSVHSEITYTMKKAVNRLMSQFKRLMNEVKLLTERDLNKEPNLGTSNPLNGPGKDGVFLERDSDTSMGSSSGSVGMMLLKEENRKKLSRKAKIFIKGEELVALLRGYQFDESRNSALIALTNYNLGYRFNVIKGRGNIDKKALDLDFSEMRLSYSDELRGINSDLFRIPSPQLRLSIVDSADGLAVELMGNLLVKLGHGLYNFPDFKKLAEQTFIGITHTAPSADDTEVNQTSDATSREELWNGRVPRIVVRLNPKIDVIGDLTADVIQMMSARLGRADVVPKLMHDNLVVPLEMLIMTVCDPLYK